MDAFRSSTSRRFYSAMSTAFCSVPASKTPFMNTYHWSNHGKIINEFSFKKMLIKGPVSTPYTFFQHSFRLTFRKGRMVSSLLFIVVYFTHLRCTRTPCLSTWLHLRFSYRIKILPIVVFIICNEVQALSMINILLRHSFLRYHQLIRYQSTGHF